MEDGRHDFHKFNEAIQNATVTFSMKNANNGIIKVLNAPCYIEKKNDGGCYEKYVICYQWKSRDTKDKGVYDASFEINFGDDLTSEGEKLPTGILNMPIREDLQIIVK